MPPHRRGDPGRALLALALLLGSAACASAVAVCSNPVWQFPPADMKEMVKGNTYTLRFTWPLCPSWFTLDIDLFQQNTFQTPIRSVARATRPNGADATWDTAASFDWEVPMDLPSGVSYYLRVRSSADVFKTQSTQDILVVEPFLRALKMPHALSDGLVGYVGWESNILVRYVGLRLFTVPPSLAQGSSYSAANGTLQSVVAAAAPNSFTYTWRVPSAVPVGSYVLEIASAPFSSLQRVISDSTPVFRIVSGQVIAASATPELGASQPARIWQRTKPYTVSWETRGTTASVTVAIIPSGGTPIQLGTVPGGSGTLDYAVVSSVPVGRACLSVYSAEEGPAAGCRGDLLLDVIEAPPVTPDERPNLGAIVGPAIVVGLLAVGFTVGFVLFRRYRKRNPLPPPPPRKRRNFRAMVRKQILAKAAIFTMRVKGKRDLAPAVRLALRTVLNAGRLKRGGATTRSARVAAAEPAAAPPAEADAPATPPAKEGLELAQREEPAPTTAADLAFLRKFQNVAIGIPVAKVGPAPRTDAVAEDPVADRSTSFFTADEPSPARAALYAPSGLGSPMTATPAFLDSFFTDTPSPQHARDPMAVRPSPLRRPHANLAAVLPPQSPPPAVGPSPPRPPPAPPAPPGGVRPRPMPGRPVLVPTTGSW